MLLEVSAGKVQRPIKCRFWPQRVSSVIWRHILSTFIVCGFCICEFACSLNFICNLKISALVSLCVICQWAPNSETRVTDVRIPNRGRFRQSPASCFCSHAVNNCPFRDLLGATFFTFLGFALVMSLFKMVPKHSAKVLSSFLKC